MRPLNLLSVKLILPAVVEKTPVPPEPMLPGAAGKMKGNSLVEMGLNAAFGSCAFGNTHCDVLVQPGK